MYNVVVGASRRVVCLVMQIRLRAITRVFNFLRYSNERVCLRVCESVN